MAATPPLRRPDTVTVTVRSSLPGADLRWLVVLLPVLLVAGLLLVRGGLVRSPLALTAGVAGLAPTEVSAVAADELERVSAPGGTGFTDTRANAFKHCVLAGACAMSMGRRTAKEITDAHENFYRGTSLGGTDNRSTKMDLKNNRIGIDLGMSITRSRYTGAFGVSSRER